jgi:hypothetical protein
MPVLTVQDTRRCNAPRMSIHDATESALYTNRQPSDAARLSHEAASTGVAYWMPAPPKDAAINCRIYDMAQKANAAHTPVTIKRASMTVRTGVMPHRLSFADRFASVVMLLNSAYAYQTENFERLQNEMRVEGVRSGYDLIPQDMMRFEFDMPWRELRDEVLAALQQHHQALVDLSKFKQGTADYHRVQLKAQKTAPEALVIGLSGMTIFDLGKWGADTLPFELMEEESEIAAWAARQEHHSRSTAAFNSDSSTSLDNGSFVPSSGSSSGRQSRASSPALLTPYQTCQAIERPPRPASLADCLDPANIQERLQAATQYRMKVLVASGAKIGRE